MVFWCILFYTLIIIIIIIVALAWLSNHGFFVFTFVVIIIFYESIFSLGPSKKDGRSCNGYQEVKGGLFLAQPRHFRFGFFLAQLMLTFNDWHVLLHETWGSLLDHLKWIISLNWFFRAMRSPIIIIIIIIILYMYKLSNYI